MTRNAITVATATDAASAHAPSPVVLAPRPATIGDSDPPGRTTRVAPLPSPGGDASHRRDRPPHPPPSRARCPRRRARDGGAAAHLRRARRDDARRERRRAGGTAGGRIAADLRGGRRGQSPLPVQAAAAPARAR